MASLNASEGWIRLSISMLLREISMTTDSVSSREQIFAPARFYLTLPRRAIETLAVWIRRARSRRELAGLSSLEMRDIGYPAAAEAEKVKPFWQA
jgi:uncharacterized protein YjiS (DUF1127 family)